MYFYTLIGWYCMHREIVNGSFIFFPCLILRAELKKLVKLKYKNIKKLLPLIRCFLSHKNVLVFMYREWIQEYTRYNLSVYRKSPHTGKKPEKNLLHLSLCKQVTFLISFNLVLSVKNWWVIKENTVKKWSQTVKEMHNIQKGTDRLHFHNFSRGRIVLAF